MRPFYETGIEVAISGRERLPEDMSERIEIVDRAERIAMLLPHLDELVQGGLIVLEDVRVIRYLHDPKRSQA